MSVLKYRVELVVELDTEEYPIPADGKMMQSLKDDIIEAIEATMTVNITGSKVTRVVSKND